MAKTNKYIWIFDYHIGFMAKICVQASVLWHSHTLFGTWVYHHGTMCRVHSWTLYDLDLWPPYQNYSFTMDMSLARCLCSLRHRHTKFWHIGVSPWDNMLRTFLTLVWPWPTWGWRGILTDFTQFLSCFFFCFFWFFT